MSVPEGKQPSRDLRLFLLLSLVLIPILGIVTYLPVVWAWSDRERMTHSEFPHQEFAVITPNAPMRWFALVYNPLMRLHAQWNGWSFHGESRQSSYPEPEVVRTFFVRQKAPAKE